MQVHSEKDPESKPLLLQLSGGFSSPTGNSTAGQKQTASISKHPNQTQRRTHRVLHEKKRLGSSSLELQDVQANRTSWNAPVWRASRQNRKIKHGGTD
jgi:hypothetical protein